MLTRRDFLKLVPTAALALLLWPERTLAREPEPQQAGNAWGFPLAFPAHFAESEMEPQPPKRTPKYQYYLNIISKNG